jgi:hypothetical protein
MWIMIYGILRERNFLVVLVKCLLLLITTLEKCGLILWNINMKCLMLLGSGKLFYRSKLRIMVWNFVQMNLINDCCSNEGIVKQDTNTLLLFPRIVVCFLKQRWLDVFGLKQPPPTITCSMGHLLFYLTTKI